MKRKPVQLTIPGHGFVSTNVKDYKGKYQLLVSEKGWKSQKQNL